MHQVYHKCIVDHIRIVGRGQKIIETERIKYLSHWALTKEVYTVARFTSQH